ncbi:MAG TPA: cytochrome c, partial [Steroidobacteraceae bacterium]|nr:cytochrome c [Steroidobacteraceae bacterium]
TINSLPRGSADPGPRRLGGGPPGAGGGAGADVAALLKGHADPEKGQVIFTTTCVVCHGTTGQGGTHGGAKLTHVLTKQGIATVLLHGRNDMPSFGSALSPQQLRDLTEYVMQLAAKH